MKLDIKYMQQLDFFLNVINEANRSKSYMIIFGLYHEEFTGKFIPNYSSREVKLKDLCAIESDEEIIVISENANYSEGIFKRERHFGENDSAFSLLVKRSNDFEPYDYYRLLQHVIKKFPIEFNEDLPNYIYDLKSTNKNTETKEFIEIPKTTTFDYVRIVPVNE
ncbi:hypothetical protein [Staphylococcus simulans]|uniref:hypothetical protein n=1 Tax=Staphylococcus simulans TaxID=1286 RepID=UPI000D03EDEA|nr:hypothetical protein [Staphylococcus simulans]